MIEVESQFPTMMDYYYACPEACRSPESDYGVWWKDDDGGNWRVSFVHHTGHFYAVCLGGTIAREIVIGGGPGLLLLTTVGHKPGLDRHGSEGPVVIIGQGEPFVSDAFGDHAAQS